MPRLKEIINVSNNIKTPSLTVFLKDKHARDADAAKEVQVNFKYILKKSNQKHSKTK